MFCCGESIENYNLLIEMLDIQKKAIKLELYLMCDHAHMTLSHMTRILTDFIYLFCFFFKFSKTDLQDFNLN